MSGHSGDAPARSPEDTRRRFLTLMGAGGAAALASMVSARDAHAGHDSTNVLHLGEFNTAANTTGLVASSTSRVLDVSNLHQGGSDAGAIQASSRGGGPAVQGNATDNLEFPPEGAGVGVLGISGSGQGVFGVSSSGPGVEGHSSSGWGVRGAGTGAGDGVEGISDSGVAGRFMAVGAGKSLELTGPVDVASNQVDDRELVIIQSDNPGAGALTANTQAGGIAVEGTAFPTEEDLEFEDQKAGYGVRGIAMSPEGGYGDGPGVGVHGASGTGIGVLGISAATGVGVEARNGAGGELLDGLALAVHGRAAFSTAGSATVPAGASSVFVPNEAVTPGSHISVTLTGDPGSRSLLWVERDAGTGFTVHLSFTPPPQRVATPFTYLIVEAM